MNMVQIVVFTVACILLMAQIVMAKDDVLMTMGTLVIGLWIGKVVVATDPAEGSKLSAAEDTAVLLALILAITLGACIRAKLKDADR